MSSGNLGGPAHVAQVTVKDLGRAGHPLGTPTPSVSAPRAQPSSHRLPSDMGVWAPWWAMHLFLVPKLKQISRASMEKVLCDPEEGRIPRALHSNLGAGPGPSWRVAKVGSVALDLGYQPNLGAQRDRRDRTFPRGPGPSGLCQCTFMGACPRMRRRCSPHLAPETIPSG